MIRIVHSPDADDYFLFWALREKLIDLDGIEFSFETYPTGELNELAVSGNPDVIAISAAVYPKIADKFLVLPHGASIGRNYGPTVVAKTTLTIEDLNTATVAIPGETTTAATIFRSLAPGAKTVVYPIAPFENVFNALSNREVDAAVLIHEGQITYQNRGLKLCLDLGKCWEEQHRLPIPLGINVINRSLGEDAIRRISSVIKAGIGYALAHEAEVISYLQEVNKSRNLPSMPTSELKRYLSMYANRDSFEFTDETRNALNVFLGLAAPGEYPPKRAEFSV